MTVRKGLLAGFLAVAAFSASCFAWPMAVGGSPADGFDAAQEEPLEEDPQESISAEELKKSDAEIRQIADDPNLDVRGKLNQVFEKYTTMGACVVVIENGEITFTHVYGLRQKDGAPVTQDTAFQVGSISKMVTGIGVMQLAEAGDIDLDADLSEVFDFSFRNPQYPATPITLRQVMSHTAGLRDSGYYNEALLGNGRPLSQLFSGDRAQYLFLGDFEAGKDVRYSNFGGGLGGSVIEKLSGQTVDEYMAENVFGPLGITAAYQPSLMPESVSLADMYAMPGSRLTKELRKDKTNITNPRPEEDYFLTAGKLVISAPDLAKLLIVLCDGGLYQDTRILKESSVKEMTSTQSFRGSISCQVSRGLYMNIIKNDQVEGRTMFGHGGKANGMLCAAYFDPLDRTGVVMLTNGCNNRKVYNNVGMLGRAIMRICYDDLLADSHVTEDPFLVE